MSTEIVELRLPDGTPVLARAELVDDVPWRPADGADYEGPSDSGFGGPSDTGLGGHSFELVTKTVRGVAGELHKALQAVSPDRVSVEIGFDLALQGSYLVALCPACMRRLRSGSWGGDAGNTRYEQSEDGALGSSRA